MQLTIPQRTTLHGANCQRAKESSDRSVYLLFRPTAVVFLAMMLNSPVWSESEYRINERPLWEAGMGIGLLTLPGYVGSDFQETYGAPYPVFYYNGEKLKVDRRAVNAIFFDNETLEVKLSLSGSPPVDSDDNDARIGMDDLDPIIEIGPSLRWRIRREEPFVEMEFPVRAAMATDITYVDQKGWSFNPKVRIGVIQETASEPITWRFTLAGLYGTDKYFNYFYGVEPEFVTPQRPRYQPEAGYGGHYVSVAATWESGTWQVGSYFRYQNIQGAEFEDSPLVEKRSAYLFGIVINKILFRSKRYVPVAEN